MIADLSRRAFLGTGAAATAAAVFPMPRAPATAVTRLVDQTEAVVAPLLLMFVLEETSYYQPAIRGVCLDDLAVF